MRFPMAQKRGLQLRVRLIAIRAIQNINSMKFISLLVVYSVPQLKCCRRYLEQKHQSCSSYLSLVALGQILRHQQLWQHGPQQQLQLQRGQ
jgi:hypothetical protein